MNATSHGTPMRSAIEQGLALSHVTVGQEVPEDLVVADARALAACALGREDLAVGAS